jgi:hypothetical protein
MSDETRELYSAEPEAALAYALGTNLALEIFLLKIGAPARDKTLIASRKTIAIVMEEFAPLRKKYPDMWPLLKEIARDGFVTSATVTLEVFRDDTEAASPIVGTFTELLADGSAFDAIWQTFSNRVDAMTEQLEKQPVKTPTHLQ